MHPDRGAGEEKIAEQLAAELLAHGGNGWIYRSDEGLPKFCQVMANAALFVAGSTGPLHTLRRWMYPPLASSRRTARRRRCAGVRSTARGATWRSARRKTAITRKT